MGNVSQAVVRIIATTILAIIGALIFGAIAHYLLGDWGIAIFVVYILMGFATGGPIFTDIDSTAVLVVAGIITSIIVFYIMSGLLVSVYGPAFTFSTELFGLSATNTGYLMTIVLGMLTSLSVGFLNN